eukprot:4859096-Lingulodinium_polyedra.AAC.1
MLCLFHVDAGPAPCQYHYSVMPAPCQRHDSVALVPRQRRASATPGISVALGRRRRGIAMPVAWCWRGAGM